MSGYFADVAALARKDLLLELRARDTLPAMLLFVAAALVIFHFALPSGTGELAGLGLLWVAIVFTALLGLSRAFVAEREQGVLDGLVLAPSDRSAIWLGKALAAFAFLALAEVVALPLFALFFSSVDGATVAGSRARGRRDLRRRRLPRRDGDRDARARAAAARALPAARDPGDRRRRRRERRRTRPGATSAFSRCTTLSLRQSAGLLLSTWLRNNALVASAALAAVLLALGDRADRVLRARRRGRPEPEDLLLPRADRADRVRVLRLGRVEGAALHLWKRPRGRGPRELRRDPPRRDLRRDDARHGLDLGASIAGASGGLWSSRQLVLFLVLFLFYCAYFMLRFSVEPGPRRANLSAVYALFGVVLIPICFLAIRLAEDFIHPTVFTSNGPQMSGSMFFTFCVCVGGDARRLVSRALPARARGEADRRAAARAAGAARMTAEEKYVAAAYLVVFVDAARLRRDHRVEAVAARARARGARRAGAGAWLSCSSGRRCSRTARPRSPTSARRARPGSPGRLATWGVRVGWLAQTALLVAQAARADGFPWATWAGSLNLFVWLVVTAYLIWGCRARFRLLGLAVTPLAAVLFVVARLGGGTELGGAQPLLEPLPRPPRRARARGVRRLHARRRRSPRSTSSRSGGSSGTTRRSCGCRRRPLHTLDGLGGRTIAVSLPALTLGMVVGLVRLERGRRRARRADGRHARDLGRLRLVPRAPLRLRLARAGAPHTSRWPRSRSSSSSGSRFPRPTSHEALARRHLAPSRARRGARARRARRAPSRRRSRASSRTAARVRVPVDVQPHGAVRRRRRRRGARARGAARARRRRGRGAVVPARRPRRGAASLSRRRRPRLARARRRARSSGRCAPRTRPARRARC